MTESTLVAGAPHYELRFTGLFDRGHGFAFPCDAAGHVDLDKLSDLVRRNDLYARAVVGREFSIPIIALVAR
ncbi:MAG TPA: hypothetical protein VGJ35_16010 [Burkholderiaceae bacterium]